MTDGQVGAVCPQCGSAAAVHSIQELAAMASARLGQQPGATAGQPGWAAEPQPGYAAEPQPGYAAEPQPGWAAEPTQGPLPGPGARRGFGFPGSSRGGFPGSSSGDGLSSLEDDIAGAALGAAARFIGRRIGRRVQDKLEQQVLPSLAARSEAMLRTQIEIADKHPDLRACLTDRVVFLAGGSRVLPMKGIGPALTVAQADALVAQLRTG